MAPTHLVVLALAAAAATAHGLTDMERAARKVPGSHVRSGGIAESIALMNKQHIANLPEGAVAVPCEQWTAGELTSFLTNLYNNRDAGFEAMYRKYKLRSGKEDGRRLQAGGKLTDVLAELQAEWAEEAALVEANPSLHDTSRDGRCFDAVNWWTHHVPSATKARLAASGVFAKVPTLPDAEAGPPSKYTPYQEGADPGAVDKVFESHAAAQSCASCHSYKDVYRYNTEAKAWPMSLSYAAEAHGAFPFWDNTGPGCTYCNPAVDPAAKLVVHYDAHLDSELLMHSNCGDLKWTLAPNAPDQAPCNHLLSPAGGFIYTPIDSLTPKADGKFCCRTYAAGGLDGGPAVPNNWTYSMNYYGNMSGFVGPHYNGSIKIYWVSIGGLSFWYYEDMDGNPVEQGEGCYFPLQSTGFKKTACAYKLPIVLYHDFDQSSFKPTNHTAADFAVPEVCRTTTTACYAPGDIAGKPFTHGARIAGVGRGGARGVPQM